MKSRVLVTGSVFFALFLVGACSSSDDGDKDAGNKEASVPAQDSTTPAEDSSTPTPDTGGGDDSTVPAPDTGGTPGACTLPPDGFNGTDNGDGSVTDATTKLTWSKTAETKKWDAAQKHCEDLDLGGKTDWRLPTIEEARSLIVGTADCKGSALGTACDVCDDSCADDFDKCVEKCEKCEIVKGDGPGGRYHSDLFPQSMTAQVWTTTKPAFAKGGMVYVVEFRDASVGQGSLMGKFATRCVHE